MEEEFCFGCWASGSRLSSLPTLLALTGIKPRDEGEPALSRPLSGQPGAAYLYKASQNSQILLHAHLTAELLGDFEHRVPRPQSSGELAELFTATNLLINIWFAL